MNKPQHLVDLESNILGLLKQTPQSDIFSKQYLTEATAQFSQVGLPSRRHEDWRYYSVDKLVPTHANGTLQTNRNLKRLADGQRSIEIDICGRSIKGPSLNGVNISFKVNGHQSLLERANHKLFELSNQDGSLLLSQLFAKQVLTIEVADGVDVTEPLVIHFPETTVERQFNACQVYIKVGENSRVTVIENHSTGQTQAIHANVVNIEVGRSSHCYHYAVPTVDSQAASLWYGLVNLRKDAVYQGASLLNSHFMSRRFQALQLLDSGGQSEVKTAYSGNLKQIVDSRTHTSHLAPNCISKQVHQGLLSGQSLGGFTGIIYVAPEALKTDGQMDNQVLLLSEESQNNSKPQLEIYADDVKCSHGFTCGRMDENQLFYMQSRGIPLELAKQKLIEAFLAKVTDDFPKYIQL